MKVFITSSWQNKHAVMMLADLLKQQNHEVLCFVYDNDNEISFIGQTKDPRGQSIDYGEWVSSAEGESVFCKDLQNIRDCKALIVIEPGGRDTWAHVGFAFGYGKLIFGLNSKGRKVGLMRRMVIWFSEVSHLVTALKGADDEH